MQKYLSRKTWTQCSINNIFSFLAFSFDTLYLRPNIDFFFSKWQFRLLNQWWSCLNSSWWYWLLMNSPVSAKVADNQTVCVSKWGKIVKHFKEKKKRKKERKSLSINHFKSTLKALIMQVKQPHYCVILSFLSIFFSRTFVCSAAFSFHVVAAWINIMF